MKEYHFIDEPCTNFDISDCQVIVSHYDNSGYGGSGWALVLNANGTIDEYNLGHCSCYGPWDDGPHQFWANLDDFHFGDVVYAADSPEEVVKKFLELCLDKQ